MFERFTDRARRVIVLAQEEASLLRHDYIGTEHLLLGLIHEGGGIACTTLEALGISLPDVRKDVEEIIGQGERHPTGHIPFTPRAKKVMELSLREALALEHKYIGTEHILLAIIREAEGVAAQVLVKRGAELTKVRERVIWALMGPGPEAEAGVEKAGKESIVRPDAEPGMPPLCPHCGAGLSKTVAYRVLDVPAADEGKDRKVAFAFCQRCGTWLGPIG